MALVALGAACVRGQPENPMFDHYNNMGSAVATTWSDGLAKTFLTHAGVFVLGRYVLPAARGSKKEVTQLYHVISQKNVEIGKLKNIIYDYEFKYQDVKAELGECQQESLKRDYEEFKQPDANGDDVISRAEFATYIHNYMKAYPHIPKEEYPTFEDFDMNRDGLVTFQEWQEYLYQQQLAEKQAAKGGGVGAKAHQNVAVHSMYDQANAAEGFQNLYAQLQQQLKTPAHRR